MIRTTHRPLTVVGVLLAMFVAAMEATVIGTAMPTVVEKLGGIESYGWVGAAYLVTATVTMPVYGRLADTHGRRPILLLAMAAFLVGSAASGLSGSMTQLIAFRALQGVGAGGLQPMAVTIVGDLFAPGERARIQGLFGAVWGVAAVSGPLLGGLLIRALSWRWVFFVNVPVGMLSAALITAFFHEPFVAVRGRAHPPVRLRALLGRRVMATSNLAAALAGGVMSSSVIYLPLYVQAVLAKSPIEAGSAVAPMLLGWPIASALSGRLLRRTGYRPLVRAGFAVVTSASVTLAFLVNHSPTPGSLGATMFVLGAGMGLGNTALFIAVQESASWEERGLATASLMFSRSVGGAVAVGALGALLVEGDVGRVFHAVAVVSLGSLAAGLLFPRRALGESAAECSVRARAAGALLPGESDRERDATRDESGGGAEGRCAMIGE